MALPKVPSHCTWIALARVELPDELAAGEADALARSSAGGLLRPPGAVALERQERLRRARRREPPRLGQGREVRHDRAELDASGAPQLLQRRAGAPPARGPGRALLRRDVAAGAEGAQDGDCRPRSTRCWARLRFRRRIRLGTAVTNPLTRHPTVTAAAFATLAELSGGRASLGISVGDSALKSMNLEAAKMSVLAETVALCRKLLGGEAVSFGEGKTAQLHHLGPSVPIYVAATGPKMLELAGRIADGVILMNGIAPELIREAVRIVREGERAAGRKEGSVKIAVWAACHPSHQAVKFNVARAILRNIPGQVDDLTRRVVATVKRSLRLCASTGVRKPISRASSLTRSLPDLHFPASLRRLCAKSRRSGLAASMRWFWRYPLRRTSRRATSSCANSAR